MFEAHRQPEPLVGVLDLMPRPGIDDWRSLEMAVEGHRIPVIPLRFDADPREGSQHWDVLSEYTPLEDVASDLTAIIISGANEELNPDRSIRPVKDVDFGPQTQEVFRWAADNDQIEVLLASCWASHVAIAEITGQDLREIDGKKRINADAHDVLMPEHPMVQGVDRVAGPHGRWASVPSGKLAEHGIDVIADHPQLGWLLAAQGKTWLWQGHPEYRQDAPLKELLRDKKDGQPIHPVDEMELMMAYWCDTKTGLFQNLGQAILGRFLDQTAHQEESLAHV